MAIIKLSPLDKEGVRFDRPSHEVTWQRLTNVLFKDGALVPRPGFGAVYGMASDDIGTILASELKNIIYIGQIRNPGSSVSGREGYTVATETVRPNASADRVAGWAGDHLDIDDVLPDGTTVISTSTAGATKDVEFAAMAVTYNTIFGAILRGRARVNKVLSQAVLGFYQVVGSALNLIGTINVGGYDPVEGTPDWMEFSFPLGANVDSGAEGAGCTTFDDATFDAFKLAVKLESTSIEITLMNNPTADATYTEWKDAVDGGTAAFSDLATFENNILLNEIPASTLHYMVPAFTGSGADKRQSFRFTVPDHTSISEVVFSAGFSRLDEGNSPLSLELYWRSGAGVETLVPLQISSVNPGFYFYSLSAIMSTNPGGGAWTSADINAGNFFIKCLQGDSEDVLRTVVLQTTGTTAGSSPVEVDYLAIDVCAATTNVAGEGIVDYTRLFSYQPKHVRLAKDGINAVSITDITNSVGMTTSPPNIPVDHATFYGQVFLVNGVDATRVYPNAGNLFTSLTTNGAGGGVLTGRTVTAFANRVLYGWVKDVTSVTPERIAYSKFNNGSTHAHVSAGDLDLLDTPGGIVKLITLNEDVCAALKEEGIYTLIRTGKAAFPFRRDVIDFETGCLAKMTAKRITTRDGAPAIVFLGENPSKGGINVFLFDGTQVVPVGNPISRKLEEETNPQAVTFSFAEVDPVTGSYWLYVAESCDELMPKSAWVMDINSLAWTRAEFPFFVSCAGQWNLLTGYTEVTSAGNRRLRGERRMVIGTSAQLPMDTRHGKTYDVIIGTDSPDLGVFDVEGSYNKGFTSTLETGDLIRPEDVQVASYRLHLSMTFKSFSTHIEVSSSEDGGKTFNTELSYDVAPKDFSRDAKKYSYFDLTPSHSNIVRYRIEIGPDLTGNPANRGFPSSSPWQIDDIRIELLGTGDGA